MKIFISHSSKNKLYGDKLVDLLRNIGIKEDEIIFTSNTAYGIPIGQNIFNWLKSQITEKPFVIYLLSEEYYQSIACLNEMGAAWIIENKHAAIFTPNFNLSSKEFQSGALDPREIGFYINDEERILSFLQLISEDFEISKSHIIISQSVKKFISEVNDFKTEILKPLLNKVIQQEKLVAKEEHKIVETAIEPLKVISVKNTDLYTKFTSLITLKKLKDDELILLHYIIETGRFKLMTGWQEQNEIDNIREWELINEIDNKLSRNYPSILKRFELRGFTEVSALTSSNNPKELKIKEEISNHLLDLPENVINIITENIDKNHLEYIAKVKAEEPEDLPF
ncbi:toll/interleukin-1 receptor domain-containing protein [Flavobacterium agrisoli]|uniref:Toll/interleukin-1 receptor domain-containing protein n=1 Tax=Flavobacterium agrisoli TaxID=2793066 RepID=A0A934PPE4_9FLAO|nr:toll/interleukin-1 receptor domain-containing protein [Flavobacterium agrisoli]MBK0371302.1 toll/interleukin-1 receptor domain-containing protein [Flavobacterium agrisoli]